MKPKRINSKSKIQKKIIDCLFFTSLFIIHSIQTIIAQTNATSTWLSYNGNHRIGIRYNLYNDIQCRSSDAFNHITQYSYRAGVGYYLKTNQNISLNIMVADSKFFDEDYFIKSTSEEKRVFEQYQYKVQKNSNIYNHRIRLEQRYFSNAPNANRFRYYFGFQKSLFNKNFLKNTFYWSAYDEIYLNFQNNVYDRNRLATGVGYLLSTNLKLECNYMVQFLPTITNRQVVFNFINGMALKK